MKLTKKYRNDLAKALRCAEKGKASHWPTIADILAAPVYGTLPIWISVSHWPTIADILAAEIKRLQMVDREKVVDAGIIDLPDESPC